jgi:hypothetical protein
MFSNTLYVIMVGLRTMDIGDHQQVRADVFDVAMKTKEPSPRLVNEYCKEYKESGGAAKIWMIVTMFHNNPEMLLRIREKLVAAKDKQQKLDNTTRAAARRTRDIGSLKHVQAKAAKRVKSAAKRAQVKAAAAAVGVGAGVPVAADAAGMPMAGDVP